MAKKVGEIDLSIDDLRAVAGYAAECAQAALAIFESARPGDARPREAIEAARAFAAGGKRGKIIRDCAWAAMRAAHDANTPAAENAARGAMGACGAAYLHPLAKATQVKHILGAAAFAARAAELAADDDPAVGAKHIKRSCRRATPEVINVLNRYPAAPSGGGRVGELLRSLDQALRSRL